ncbi:MAG: hypothetical protein QY322_01100 [bacterium]|nr:MAG: hypothetical protein QY322_01100 [bacterium]
MDQKRLLKFIAAISLLCILAIVAINLCSSLGQSLKDNLTSEIVGGGIVGGVIAAIFYYLQESNEYQASKSRAKSFYERRLLVDIQEAYDRGPSVWNLSGLNKFYFDGSHINPLFDVYQANFDQINNHDAYYPDNDLINKYNDFYQLTRKAYVLGEKMEGILYQNVRANHHQHNVDAANDRSVIQYLRGRLFSNMTDQQICKYIGWSAPNQRVTGLHAALIGNADIQKRLKELKDIREKLVKLTDQIKRVHKKEHRASQTVANA